ncbi:MAG: sensor domain-containing diguanylate cyclase [Lysobacter sp.]
MRHWLPAAVCALALWMGGGPPPAAAQALHVEVLLTDGELDGPPASAAVLTCAEAAQPGDSVQLAVPRRDGHYWLRITSDRAFDPGQQQVLVLNGSHGLGAVTFYPPGAPPRVVLDARAGGSALLRRGWVLPLPHGWPEASVAYLQVSGHGSEPLRLRMASTTELIHEQRNGARLGAATATAMLVMVLAMLGLWAMFRDVLYLGYAGYLACVIGYTLVLSGDATEIPGLDVLIRGGATVSWGLATLAVVLQLVFSLRFLELDRVAPRAAGLVRVLLWLHVGLLATLLLGRELVRGWYPFVGNTLLVTCAPLLLLVAVLAWRRGAVYGGWFLLGWSPMVLVAATAGAHQLGLLQAAWADGALPLLAVLESLVLAVALAHHAIARHRLALRAQDSLECDPLTGALDGDALLRLLGSWYRRASFGRNSYGMLMLEIEQFDALRAQRGKVFGDAVLQQALARMRTLLRADDTIARIDGARFAIVSECRREDCEHLAERIGEGFARQPFRIDGRDIAVGVSVGLVMSKRGESAAELLQRAVRAMQQAREREALRVAFMPANATAG